MKILHVISGIDACAGGPAVALAGLCEAQAAAGLAISLLSTFGQGTDLSVADSLRQKGIEVHLIGPCRQPMSRHRAIRATMMELTAHADIVHIHGLWEEVQHEAAKAARQRSIPYVMTPHGMLNAWSMAQSKWRKRLYLLWRLRRHLNNAAMIHYASQFEREASSHLKLRTPALVEPLGVRLEEFDVLPPKGMLRQRFPQLRERRTILFLGRIHPRKGLEHLVPALAELDDRQAVLVVVGPDSNGYQRTISKLAQKHGVEDRVLFTGLLRGAERIEAIVDADLFALPSEHENFGLAVVEALAAGVPVIISDQVSMHREVLAALVGGVVPAQATAVANELNRWLADPNLREDAAARARPFVWEHYDWRRIAQRWAGHYATVLGESNGRAGRELNRPRGVLR